MPRVNVMFLKRLFRKTILSKIVSIFVLSAAVLSFAQNASLAQDGKLAIAGTTVSLVPPQGFSPATGFAGLTNPKTKASVLVAELPAVAYEQIAAKLTTVADAKTAFAAQRVDVRSLEQVDIAGQKVPLIIGRQTANAVEFDKWIVILKGARTVLLTVQAPASAKLPPAEVRAMLASVTLGGEPSLDDKLKALPFAIRAAEPFRIVDTIGGSGVLMTVGPLNADPAGTQPMLIAAYQLAGPTIRPDQLEPTAEMLLKRMPGFGSATVAAREKVRFAGSDGVRLSGSYVHEKGGDRRFEQYVVVGPSGRYAQLVVYAGTDGFDGLKPAIQAIVDSLAFTDAK